MASTEKQPAKGKKVGKSRNYDLGNGIVRFSRTKMFHKKALYKFIGKKVAAEKKPVKPRVIEKQIGGEKNGGKRFVLVEKRRAVYPTQERIKKRPAKQLFKDHSRTSFIINKKKKTLKKYLKPFSKLKTLGFALEQFHKQTKVTNENMTELEYLKKSFDTLVDSFLN